MNGETGDCNTPVRRSSRARKPNSRFADDELDGCFKKIVTGLTVPEASTASTGASPARQKKSGKKRESESEEKAGTEEIEEKAKTKVVVEDNAVKSEEAASAADDASVIAVSQTKPDDVINGPSSESESLAASMGKTKSGTEKSQERRTRSNAKNAELGSLPKEEKKRGGKKGGKAKSSKGSSSGGGEVECSSGSTKSEEKIINVKSEDDQDVEKVCTSVSLVEDGKEKLPLQDACKVLHDEGWPQATNILPAVQTHHLHVNKQEVETKRDESATLEQIPGLDLNSQSEKVTEETNVKDVDIDCGKVIVNEKETVKLLLRGDSKESVEPHKALPGSRSLDILDSDKCSLDNSQMSVEPMPCVSTLVCGDSPNLVQLPSSSVDETKQNLELIKSIFAAVKDDQIEKPECVKEEVPGQKSEEILNAGVESCTLVPSTRLKGRSSSSSDNDSSLSKQKGHVATEPNASTPSKRKGAVDFTEAETSTPTRNRGCSDATETEISTPTRCKGGSDISKVEPFTPTRRRGRSDSSELHIESSPQHRERSDSNEVNTESLPQHKGQSGVSESEASASIKRRGRSSKQPLVDGLKDDEEPKAPQTTVKKVTKKSMLGIKKLNLILPDTSKGDLIDTSKVQVEKSTSESKHPIESLGDNETDSFNVCGKIDEAPERSNSESHNVSVSGEQQPHDMESEGKGSIVTKGKRGRSEQHSGGGGEGEQSFSEHQGYPELKKRREDLADVTDSSPEEDQKRKRQDEPDDHAKRKRKKEEEEEHDDIFGAPTVDGKAPNKDKNNVEKSGVVVCDSDAQGAVQAVSSPLCTDGDNTCKNTVEDAVISVPSLTANNAGNSTQSESKDTKDEKKSNKVQKKSGSGTPVKGKQTQQDSEEENSDIKERRQSSIGNILSLLKRPNVNITRKEDQSDRKWKGGDRRSREPSKKEDRKWQGVDCGSTETSKRQDRKGAGVDYWSMEETKRNERRWRTDDHGSRETTKREDRKWRSDDHSSIESRKSEERKRKISGDELIENTKKEDDDKVCIEEKHAREKKPELSYVSKRRDSAQDGSQASDVEFASNSRTVKTADTDAINTYDWGDAGTLTWAAMKESSQPPPLLTSGTGIQKGKKTTKVVEPDFGTKGKESEFKGEDNDIEERRNSSIGNILSFLKRGSNTPGPELKRDTSRSSSEGGSKASSTADESKIFSFIERERKSSSFREEFSSYGNREDGGRSEKSKSLPKTRERRSRWSAREESTDASNSQWESIHSFTKDGTLSSNKDDNRPTWSEQRSSTIPTLGKWGNIPSQHQVQVSTEKNTKVPSLSTEKPSDAVPYSTWKSQSSSWKSWTDDRNQRSFPSQNQTQFEAVKAEKSLKEPEKHDGNLTLKDSSVSDDDNIDFGNREGLSEFIESYADELDQSDQATDDVSLNANQTQNTYGGALESTTSSSVGDTWAPKNDEAPLSPTRETYLSPRSKELGSPQREPVWSPRSSEVVLSPKSRELMSSLRNMEVKLTPQMQELMSQKNQDSVSPPQELHHYPIKHDDDDDDDDDPSFYRRKDGGNAFDVLSIPLPIDSGMSIPRKYKGSGQYAKADFPSKSQQESQQQHMLNAIRSLNAQEGRSSSTFESSWRSHTHNFERSLGGRYNDVKDEADVESGGDRLKEESYEDQHFDDRGSSFRDEIHDDKENLEPKVEEKELTEEEKLEFQRKKQKDLEVKEEKNKLVVEQRMKAFVHLKDNLYLGDRKKSKKSKEVRRMICDCSLTKEEITRGEVGCGEDCLNRLLMIECGSRCPLKDRCTNKRFQNYNYEDVEVFNADEKGCGIRARSTIPAGSFIMEYVGEVFDSREFKRRRKEYSRNHNAHFYFMALKGDLFIDATRKGNISRFINHSCDPNAQTQKWTVNGELRVGFFANKDIEVDEEINFDYRLERYGREAQRCYCGTSVCRGWLGEPPDEKTKEEKEEERRQERDRRKREEKRLYLEDNDLEEEIDKLITIELRTRQDVLNLCRLMVRADNFNSRVMLLHLVQSSTSGCKRLFLDYHGLSVLWSWMADLGYAYEHASMKIEILKTLECLPITNKTQLTDSRVLGVVERWSTQSVEIPTSGSPPPPPPPRPGQIGSASINIDSESGKKSSDTSEDSDAEMDVKPVSMSMESSVDDTSMDSADIEQDALKSKPNLEGCLAESDSSDSNLSDESKDKKKSAVEPGVGDTAATAASEDEATSQELLILHKSMVELAIKLLEHWQNLKEYFRIPKKERLELIKEHEREVEEEIRGLDKDRKDKDKYRRDFDRKRRSPDREKDKGRHSRRASRGDRDREDKSSDSPKMSKEQRRQLFEIQAQQEEEEAKQRKMQEEMWAMHVERCRLLGQDPYLTPIFDPTCQFYWDPNTASWQPYNGTDPNIPVPAAYGYRPNDSEEGSPMILGMPPAHLLTTQPIASDGEAGTPNYDDPLIDPATIPLPGEVTQTSPTQPLPCQAVPVEGTPPQGARVLTFPVTGEAGAMTPAMPVNIGASALTLPFVVGEEPPPPPPGPITIQLPPRWKMARDSEGHVYFYHIKSRTSQWEPPTLEQHQHLEAGLGSESESDSSSSDSDSTSTTDSEDFSSDEEEEEEEVQVTTVERGELSDEKMIRRHRGAKKMRSEALVQERVISPVLEMDKETARRERREAKERAQKEAREERQEDKLVESTQETSNLNEDIEPVLDKIQRMERPETLVEKERHEHRESKAKIRDKTKSKERAATAIADNSDSARKCKENFRAKMATYIVSVLNPYRRDDCKIGRITCNEDFKYLARKLTHFVMIKELKQLHSVEDLECNDSVKYKTKDFVRKYMSKYGHEFKRDPMDTKEY